MHNQENDDAAANAAENEGLAVQNFVEPTDEANTAGQVQGRSYQPPSANVKLTATTIEEA